MFGMGTGGTLRPLPPQVVNKIVAEDPFRFCSFKLCFLRNLPLPSQAAHFLQALLSLCPLSDLLSLVPGHFFCLLPFLSSGSLPLLSCFQAFRFSASFLFQGFLRSFLPPAPWQLYMRFEIILVISIGLCQNRLNQAIDLLVSSSCMHYCTSTDDLSTW